MGSKNSKPSIPMGGLPKVPKDTPLGYILSNWKNFPGTSGKEKYKMISYCTKVWGGKQISKSVYWPVYGSEEDWVRQQLNLWVNTKTPFNPEESDYAKIWIQRPQDTTSLYPISETKEKREKRKEELEESLLVPPPYAPPPMQAPAIPQAPAFPSEPNPGSPPSRPRTRSQRGTTQIYPLREIPMGGAQPEIGFISVPLNSTDLRDFKKE